MARLSITKCQGTGNDFVLVDRTDAPLAADWPEIAKILCDRHLGVGGDGMLLLGHADAPGADVALRIFNADGSPAEMCGNGVRCIARYLYERRPHKPIRAAVQTPSGTVRTEIVKSDGELSVRVDMGVPEDVTLYERPNLAGMRARAADVTLGNPHSVAFVDAPLLDIDLAAVAHAIARDGGYEDGVNVEVARLFPNGLLAMRVYERGVGETQACGTGACAVALAAIEMGKATSPVRVQMEGGDVTVEWGGRGQPAYLTGGAELVFDTAVDIAPALLQHHATAP